ncbi:MAG TPA: DUF1573 domain-containing protein [Edaphocola sp.]|nr:DUF1573 domain-containing protein [Edaphocola sp.]
MKKTIVSIAALLLLSATVSMAQAQRKSLKKASTEQKDENTVEVMKFNEEVHDFGKIKEGSKAEFVFEFVNKSKKPITIQNVSSSCGCTVPSWSKEPVAPKKKGQITVNYRTTPGPINKQVTVMTDAGNKVLRITGSVEAKPAASVPQKNSAIKMN